MWPGLLAESIVAGHAYWIQLPKAVHACRLKQSANFFSFSFSPLSSPQLLLRQWRDRCTFIICAHVRFRPPASAHHDRVMQIQVPLCLVAGVDATVTCE